MRRLIFTLVAAGLVLFHSAGHSVDEGKAKLRPDSNGVGRSTGQTTGTSKPQSKKPDRTLEDTAGTPGGCEVPSFSPFQSGSLSCRL